jgi:CRP/FNR family transcriptional regulator, cyclic AMP receptor protein
MAQAPLTREQQLKKVPLFSQLGKKSLAEIARLADRIDVRPGEVVVRQGEYGDQFVMILEGEAKVERDGKVINRLSPDAFFGEIALIAHRPRTATVIAETPMKVLAVHKSHFEELLETTPGLWKDIAVALSGYITSED